MSNKSVNWLVSTIIKLAMSQEKVAVDAIYSTREVIAEMLVRHDN